MQKTLKTLFIMGFMAILLPQITTACNYSIPEGAVGLSEAAYQQLKNSHCYMGPQEGGTVAIGGLYCDSFIAPFVGKIVFRAAHHGEMYWVNTGDGLPLLNRYLPDGIYKVGKKYYLMDNGRKLKLNTQDCFSTMENHVKSGSIKYYGVNNADWTLMNSETVEGNALRKKMAGKIFILTEQDGSLWYVSTGINNYVHAVSGKLETTEDFLASESYTGVSKSLMKKMIRHNAI